MAVRITVAIIAFGTICLTALPLNAQRKTGSETKVAAHGGVVAEDQEIGRTFRVNPDELPQPKATKAVSNGPLTVPFNGQAANASGRRIAQLRPLSFHANPTVSSR